MPLVHLSKNHVFRTEKEALRHWKRVRKRYEQIAYEFFDHIRNMDNEYVSWVAAAIVDVVCVGYGHFYVEKEGPKALHVSGVYMDKDCIDAACSTLQSEDLEDEKIIETFEEARQVIVEFVSGRSSVAVAWGLGPIRPLEGEEHRILADEDRIVYSTKKGRVIGVLSHYDGTREDCVIFPIPKDKVFPEKRKWEKRKRA